MRVRCKKDFVLIILEEVVVKWDYSVDGVNMDLEVYFEYDEGLGAWRSNTCMGFE